LRKLIRANSSLISHTCAARQNLAAAWFRLCGRKVAFPAEADNYDLLVDMPGGLKRVQVKTTTFKSKDGWLVQIGRRPYAKGNNALLVPYDPEIIELFFIVDGDLAIYLIPSRVIAGRVQILLRIYSTFIVGNAAGLMVARPSAA
jgi:PD-(D/E)XK endonuclease